MRNQDCGIVDLFQTDFLQVMVFVA